MVQQHLFMKKHLFPYLIMLSLAALSACTIGQSSTGGQGTVASAKKDRIMTPSQCKINGKVVRVERPGVYLVRVYQVLEVGSGFSQELAPGDKIEVIAPIPLSEKEIIDLSLTWVPKGTGGQYEITTGAQ